MKSEHLSIVASVIIVILILVGLVTAMDQAGAFYLNDQYEPEETGTNDTLIPEDVKDPVLFDYQITDHYISLIYRGTEDPLNVTWDFGDNVGNYGLEVFHEYYGDGPYLITMYAKYYDDQYADFNRTVTDELAIEFESSEDENVTSNGIGLTRASSAFLIIGIGGFVLAFIGTSEIDLPPDFITPRMYFVFGIGMIFNFIMAIGMFNFLYSIS